MKIKFLGTLPFLFAAACQTTTTPPLDPGLPIIQPDFADGIAMADTPWLAYPVTLLAQVHGTKQIIGTGSFLFINTDDPNQFYIRYFGEDVLLKGNGGNGFSGRESIIAEARIERTSSSNQVRLFKFDIEDLNPSYPNLHGYFPVGLFTDPNQMPATGSAQYSGTATMRPLISGALQVEWGTIDLAVDFSNGSLSGSMGFTYLPPLGGSTSPYSISIDPTTIAANGFTTTLTANPTHLGLTDITNTAIDGAFFGPGASDVGGVFLIDGIAADGTTPELFVGGFIAE